MLFTFIIAALSTFTTVTATSPLSKRYNLRCNGNALPTRTQQSAISAVANMAGSLSIEGNDSYHVQKVCDDACVFVTLRSEDGKFYRASAMAVADGLRDILGACGESGGSTGMVGDLGGVAGLVVHMTDHWV